MITATLKGTITLCEYKESSPPPVEIHAGVYFLVRIPNPRGRQDPWLVIEGTMIGLSETAWRRRIGINTDEEVVIEEDGALMLPHAR